MTPGAPEALPPLGVLAVVGSVLGAGVFLASFIVVTIRLVSHGGLFLPGRYRAWRIRREALASRTARALRIQAEHPEIPYHCDNWPRWKSLCGYCCAVSRADRELVAERAQVDQLLRGV